MRTSPAGDRCEVVTADEDIVVGRWTGPSYPRPMVVRYDRALWDDLVELEAATKAAPAAPCAGSAS